MNILAQNQKSTLRAIAKVLDLYDPTTSAGTQGNRRLYAHWARALLWWLDNNHVRVRGLEEGRRTLDADRRLLDREQVGGMDDRAANNYSVYAAALSQYDRMSAVNDQDVRISRQLREARGIQLSDDEMKSFSNFLVRKDPRYQTWSKSGHVDGKRWRILNIEPYYQAYLEFKTAQRIR